MYLCMPKNAMLNNLKYGYGSVILCMRQLRELSYYSNMVMQIDIKTIRHALGGVGSKN